jgi:catechol 2,3-dioxygenase-like lactoylglutathione lyase family enzyme
MNFTHVFAGLPVSDYDAAVAWYEELLGKPPDMLPTDGEAMWHLREGGSLYVVVDAEHAGGGHAALAVESLGSLPGEPGPGGMPTAVVNDPDGNRLTVFEDPSA